MGIAIPMENLNSYGQRKMAENRNESRQEEGEETPSVSKRGISKKGLILSAGTLLLLAMGFAGVHFLAPGVLPDPFHLFQVNDSSKKETEPSKAVPGYLYNMDPFVVNLADTEQPRYLKVRMDIESLERKVNEEYERKLPQLRDAILTVLTNKTYKEVLDGEGKKKLKEEIVARLNQHLRGFRVKTVYFTEFVVQ
ncbi:MAG: flagellar basal body protein FliL [Deltaproteobacteria bacterium]|nr:MAG: flagellar basal body protein FliL [Deltaproteobacteria bacterium]